MKTETYHNDSPWYQVVGFGATFGPGTQSDHDLGRGISESPAWLGSFPGLNDAVNFAKREHEPAFAGYTIVGIVGPGEARAVEVA